MNPDLDTLATTLYVTVDDLLVEHPEWAPQRPAVGIAPKLSDAELVTLAVIQALLRFDSEARFIRYAHAHLGPWFPYLPARPGCNKRLRRSARLLQHVIAWLARNSPSWYDDLWLVDSTPVECGRSRQTQQRSDLAGWAEYGYSPSHSRYFWGLRLHLVATPAGLPVPYALSGAKADERDTALGMITTPGWPDRARLSWPTKGTSGPASRKLSTPPASASSGPLPKQRHPDLGDGSSNDSARSSKRSTRPSNPNSVSNDTEAAPQRASPSACSNAYSPSPPPSRTTTPPSEQA